MFKILSFDYKRQILFYPSLYCSKGAQVFAVASGYFFFQDANQSIAWFLHFRVILYHSNAD
jgi:hypothetical protein